MTQPRAHEGPERPRPAVGKRVGRGQRSSRCNEPPPPGLLKGIDEFNRHEFYECHETIEEVWLEEPDPVRHMYQGILKVGVGFYHAMRGNHRGALIVMGGGIELLQPFRPSCMGIDIEALHDAAVRALEAFERLGPGRVQEFDRSLIPTISVNAIEGAPQQE